MLARLTILVLCLLLAGYVGAQLRLVVSIAPYGDLAQQLGGELVEVDVVLPPGASPHTFEPTPQDAARLTDADLVLLNGGTDEWLHETVEAVNPEVRVLEALDVLAKELQDELEQAGDAEPDHEREPEEHSHLGVNPHVWLDPVLMQHVVEALAATLAAMDEENSDAYLSRSAELVEELSRLDRELNDTLAPVRNAPFIPFHDAWPYFARRYGLDLIVEIEPFPGREPSPRYLATVVGVIRSSGAPAIFTEVGLSERPARVLADEAGVDLYRLDPLGRSGENYQDLLRRNAATILEALSPWEPR